MKAINYFMILAVASVALASCELMWDRPEINFEQEELKVPAEGGNYIIKVVSTGVDYVYVLHNNLEYGEDGDLYPGEEWITINKVIYHYTEDATRELPSYISGVDITVAPNTTGELRSASIYARSFSKTDDIVITQYAEGQTMQ